MRNCIKNALCYQMSKMNKSAYWMCPKVSTMYGSTAVNAGTRYFLTYPGQSPLSVNRTVTSFNSNLSRLYSAYRFHEAQYHDSLSYHTSVQKGISLKGRLPNHLRVPTSSYLSSWLKSNVRLKHTMPRVPPTRMNNIYEIEGAITDREAAKQFVYALNSNERKHLYAELAQFHGESVEATDPTQDKPTRQQLKQVALHQMFPFIGFGFLDNFLMIVAGEYIDVTLGVTLGISTMAAAALGNLISDVAGLGSAHYVEILAAKVGVKNPHLSPAQVDMGSTKFASNMGKVIGVTIGCILGMVPLLFFPDEKKDEKKTTSESSL